MQIDPRTVARDIPGIFDVIFPQLTPGLVMHFNQQAESLPIRPLPAALLEASNLQRSMLFELAYSVAEILLEGRQIDWATCLETALIRQREYFDANLPTQIGASDKEAAELVGRNLEESLRKMSQTRGEQLTIQPCIPGLEWIASGKGDFALGNCLIEVKCTAKRFSSSDYRQVAIYWLLSYASAIEGRGTEWSDFALLNPRRGEIVQFDFTHFLSTISSGRAKTDILQMFQSIVGSRIKR